MNPPAIDGLSRLTDDTLAALRSRFERVGYLPAMLGRAESVAPNQFDALRVPLVRDVLAKLATPAADLTRIFAYGDAISNEQADAALGAELTKQLTDAGVLASREGGIVSRFQWLPIDALWILADEPRAGSEAVMSPGPTTLHLLSAMPHRSPARVLDVGCGPGTLALVAAKRGATHAIGTDISDRAIELARFNARFNAVRADFRVGDLLEPVRGERFHLVVAQPPYVIQPPDTPAVTFLHGGAMGDEITMRLLAGLPAVLADDGLGLVLFDSPTRANDPLHARVRRALGTDAIDLLILAAPSPPPEMHAMAYGSVEAPDFGEGYGRAAVRYLRHLESLGIREITHALVALRPRVTKGGTGFVVTLPVRALPGTDAPEQIESLFAALDLARSDNTDLLRAKVAPSKRARWCEERPRPDPSVEPTWSVRFPQGIIAADRELSEAVVALVHALDSSESVDEAVTLYAEICSAEPAEVRPQVLDFVRESLARGLLQIGG